MDDRELTEALAEIAEEIGAAPVIAWLLDWITHGYYLDIYTAAADKWPHQERREAP